MNKPLLVLSTALLLTSTSSAFAASSTNLTVKGLITPSACEPGLSSGGIVDHGKRSVNDLSPVSWTLLGKHTLQLTITCGAPTLIALQGVDNKRDSAMYDQYGLGLVSGVKLGYYGLGFDNAMDGGAELTMLTSLDGVAWDIYVPGDAWSVSDLASFGDRSTGSWAPTPVQNVTADLKIETLIAPTKGMNLNEEVPFEGSATLEVKYL